MLDNDQVKVQQIKDIQEDIDNYIENSQEPDFFENEFIYEDIEGLEEMLLDVSLSFMAVSVCVCVCLYHVVSPHIYQPAPNFHGKSLHSGFSNGLGPSEMCLTKTMDWRF